MRLTIRLPLFAPPEPQRILCQLAFPGEPGTKARPRFNGQVYTPRQTKEAQDYIAWSIRKAYPQLTMNRSHDLGVCVGFFTKNRQRKDLDNLIKLLFDACNGLLWADDVQVIQVASSIVRGDITPRTEFLVYTIGKGYRGLCETCQNPLPQQGVNSVRTRREHFCSKPCYDAAQRQGRYVSCATCQSRIYKQNEKLRQAHQFCSARCRALFSTQEKLCRYCQQIFRDSSSRLRGRSFCSSSCREAWHNIKRPPSQKRGICPHCGKPSSRAGTRCQPCFVRQRFGREPLSAEEKQAIVQRWLTGESMQSLAKAYGVKGGAIATVIHMNAPIPRSMDIPTQTILDAQHPGGHAPHQMLLFVA